MRKVIALLISFMMLFCPMLIYADSNISNLPDATGIVTSSFLVPVDNGYLTYRATIWQLLGLGINISGSTQGDVLYYNGLSWVRLPAGTPGYFLETNGSGANAAWASAATATSLSGTVQYSVPYQSASGVTGYAAPVNSAIVVTNSQGVPYEMPISLSVQTLLGAQNNPAILSDIGAQAAGNYVGPGGQVALATVAQSLATNCGSQYFTGTGNTCASPSGSGNVSQSGSINSGDLVTWASSGSIQDGGKLPVSSIVAWSFANSSVNASNGTGYMCNTTGGSFNVNLGNSATCTTGSIVEVCDASGTFLSNSLTVGCQAGANNCVIMGIQQDMIINTQNICVSLICSGNSTYGWRIQ